MYTPYTKNRRLTFEELESRKLLATVDGYEPPTDHSDNGSAVPDSAFVEQNSAYASGSVPSGLRMLATNAMRELLNKNGAKFPDTNGSGTLDADDVLRLINYMNEQPADSRPPANSQLEAWYDVNQDFRVTPLDALIVINYLNRDEKDMPCAAVTHSLEYTGDSTFFSDKEILTKSINIDSGAIIIILDGPLHGTMTREVSSDDEKGFRYDVENNYTGGDRFIFAVMNSNGKTSYGVNTLHKIPAITPASTDAFFST